MSLLTRVLRSSVGRKQIVALTGLGLLGFLALHLAGNLLLLVGPEKFDAYAHSLEENPLLIPAEIGLAAVFLIHIAMALKLNLENRAARPQGYLARGSRGARNAANSTMAFSGILVLVFVIVHLLNFKFASRSATFPSGAVREGSLYWVVVAYFQRNLLYVAWYLAAVAVLALHLSHGFQSVFQTLGLQHPKYRRAIEWAGAAVAFIVALGYGVLPVYACFFVKSP